MEEERRIQALLNELPGDRTITEPEAGRFWWSCIAPDRVRPHRGADQLLRELRGEGGAPPGAELIRAGATRGKKAPPGPLLFDLRVAREAWRAEGYRVRRAEQNARMRSSYLAGDPVRDIVRREGIGQAAAMKRISEAAKPL